MTEYLNWGLPIIGYFFLAGTGAGAATVSASVLLRGGGGGFGGQHFRLARYGAMIAPLPVMIGSALLILELGSFEAGSYFKFLYLFSTINLSPMSVGSWLLMAFIAVSLAYAYTFLDNDASPNDRMAGRRRALAWITVPFGIAVAIYTGVLLGAMPARPFWNSPIIAMLFMISSLSTGVAAILLARALLHAEAPASEAKNIQFGGYLLTASDLMLIGFEAAIVFLFVMFGYLTVGDVGYAVDVIMPGGSLAALFWVGFVLIGLLLPALVELRYVLPKLLYHKDFSPSRSTEMLVSTVVLLGGFMLRYVVVIAGQITGPVGI
ncbi:MAG: hypothetical protein A3G18_02090 [Rhodospirillales bacterium RIFCSPLOWO2_12_FULL_58_28]|nr:MAG: hypothetical protein A3H92_07425 [Rhodospirillales bacterium RIFCSPLOWO2_02_FULL_58_16]OHC79078.1 MAG: hypothetical protein A3G18_02090 [Rhodospirillales bacterium RIFCSPLOWO2_12_FULL_58_28]